MKLAQITWRLSSLGGRSEHGRELAVKRTLQAYYLSGKPPWDSGIPAPELVAAVEGPYALPPGPLPVPGC
ncbi:hypothetical protein [Nonomuraea helvata]|uniref:Uncharacterized protein n=1 Tax=Nonomuraea helvata TaxID=37484 RepID=A0ABV5SLA1_9ACTN